MPRTVTPDCEFFAEISKIDEEKRQVFGYASTDVKDRQGETVTRDAIAKALPDYMIWKNVREMHRHDSAVGTAIEANMDSKGLYFGAHVVDDAAWDKVKKGVYKGFSIGGRVTSRDPLDKSIVTGVDLTEISLVDRPANPQAEFMLIKRSDDHLMMQPTQKWDCGIAGHQHITKSDAATCMADCAERMSKGELVCDLLKFNQNHDAKGEFSSGDGGNKSANDEKASMNRAEFIEPEKGASPNVVAYRRPDGSIGYHPKAADPDVIRYDGTSGPTSGGHLGNTGAAALLGHYDYNTKIFTKAPDVSKRDFSQGQRDKLADTGAAMPDGSFPIANTHDLKNAIMAHGRAKNPAATKAHIISRAKSLGAESELPDGWGKSEGLTKYNENHDEHSGEFSSGDGGSESADDIKIIPITSKDGKLPAGGAKGKSFRDASAGRGHTIPPKPTTTTHLDPEKVAQAERDRAKVNSYLGKATPRAIDGGKFAGHSKSAMECKGMCDKHTAMAAEFSKRADKHRKLADESRAAGNMQGFMAHDRIAQSHGNLAANHTRQAADYAALADKHSGWTPEMKKTVNDLASKAEAIRARAFA